MRLIGLAVVLMLSLALVPFVAEARQSGSAAKAYRIGPEDVLSISVWKNDTLSGTVPVRPDGKISLPLINEVQAAGLTARELQDVLIERFTEFIPSPEVSVIVSDVRSIKVCVGGETTRPGCYEVRRGAIVLDALAPAGRFTRPLMWDGIFMPNGRPFPR
jgi:polysaccharide export outer membrane protein